MSRIRKMEQLCFWEENSCRQLLKIALQVMKKALRKSENKNKSSRRIFILLKGYNVLKRGNVMKFFLLYCFRFFLELFVFKYSKNLLFGASNARKRCFLVGVPCKYIWRYCTFKQYVVMLMVKKVRKNLAVWNKSTIFANEFKNTVGVAQLVRVPDCGSEGRGFESHLPPKKVKENVSEKLLLYSYI